MWNLAELYRTSILVTIALYAKFYATNQAWAILKTKADQRAPEDPFVVKNPSEGAVAKAQRMARIVQNDLENIPFGMIMIWASVVCISISLNTYTLNNNLNDYEKHVQAHVAFTVAYLVARASHTCGYWSAIWVWRMLSFTLGMTCLLGLLLNATICVWKIPTI